MHHLSTKAKARLTKLTKITFIPDLNLIFSSQSGAALHKTIKYMQHTVSCSTVQNVFAPKTYPLSIAHKPTKLKRFLQWCNEQEKYRFLWLGISLFGHIGMVLPLTLLSIIFFGCNNFTLWIIACAVNVPVLALNLAAQPPKVTLPVMFVSLFANLVIIAVSVAMFFI